MKEKEHVDTRKLQNKQTLPTKYESNIHIPKLDKNVEKDEKAENEETDQVKWEKR